VVVLLFRRKIGLGEQKPMASERANNLQAFKSFIDQQLALGNVDLGLDEALAHWKRENEGGKDEPEAASTTNTSQANPGEWVRCLQAWVDSLPVRPTRMDDSRESIYAGRGE
jgi:hypothetical protein